MKILAWNCRGLGAARAVQEMAKLVRFFRPKLLFLSETKRTSNEMSWLRCRWGFDHCFSVNCQGRSGGLALLWRKEVKVSIRSFTTHHIDAVIEGECEGEDWRFTGFYGHPETSKRK